MTYLLNKNITKGEITKQSFSNPHPGSVSVLDWVSPAVASSVLVAELYIQVAGPDGIAFRRSKLNLDWISSRTWYAHIRTLMVQHLMWKNLGSLLLTWINFNLGISNHMPSKVWDEITYPFPNFNDRSVEVWEGISNFILHFIMGLITHPFWD